MPQKLFVISGVLQLTPSALSMRPLRCRRSMKLNVPHAVSKLWGSKLYYSISGRTSVSLSEWEGSTRRRLPLRTAQGQLLHLPPLRRPTAAQEPLPPQAMPVTVDTGLPSGSSKRRATEGGGYQAATAEEAKLAEAMGKLPVSIGEGEYQQPLMMGMLQAIATTARDVADLRMAVVKSYEGPVQWSYPAEAAKSTKTYAELARQVKGTKTNLGPAKNYAAAGLLIALLDDNQVGAEDKDEVRSMMRPRCLDAVPRGRTRASGRPWCCARPKS